MFKKILQEMLISSAIEGTTRTLGQNSKNIVENTADVFFEKGDKAIDDFFDPLIELGDKIDRLFGW
jgi:hypothetical protein